VSEVRWHHDKHRRNLARGRIGFDEAVSAFDDPNAISWPDVDHSWEEDRVVTIGITAAGRFARVVTSLDDQGTIRIISARRPSRRERHAYETRRPLG
jgi:hypothetical protein